MRTVLLSAAVFILLLPVGLHAGAPTASMVRLTPGFFNHVMDGLAPALSSHLAGLTFPAEGTSACAEVLINGGSWFSSVNVPNNATTVTGAPNTVTLATSNVVVSGLEGGTSWSSMIQSSVPGAWSTCFQLCFGSSPFTATTSFGSVVQMVADAGTPITATAQSSNLLHDGSWHLDTLNNVCIGNQAVFEAQFNAGVASALASSELATATLVEGAFNTVLVNSSRTGLPVSTFEDGVFSMATVAGLPLPAQFPLQPLPTGVDVGFTSQLDADVVPAATTASCVYRSGCGGAPTLNFAQCVACVQALDDQMYLALEVSARAGNGETPRHQATANPKVHRRVAHWKPSQRVVVERGKQTSRFFTPAVGTTENFLSGALLTQTMELVGTAAAKLLSDIQVPALSNGRLPHATPYCGLNHQGFSFGNIPAFLDIVANAITTQGNLTLVEVELPQLAAISGVGNFDIACSVDLPLGAPFRDAARGNFSVGMTAPQSRFRVTAAVHPDRVEIFNFPDLEFTSTVTYAEPAAGFTFDAYTQDLFVGTIGQYVTSTTQQVLQVSMPALWLKTLDGLLLSYAGSTAVTASQDAQGWSIVLLAGPSTAAGLVTLDAVVPAAQQPSGFTAGSVALVAPAPSFPIPSRSCSHRKQCSSTAQLNGELFVDATMRGCGACVVMVNDSVALGVAFNLSYTPAAPGRRGALRPERTVLHHERGAAVSHPQPLHSRSARRPRRGIRSQGGISNTTSTSLYVGVGILTEATSAAGAAVYSAISNWTHPQVTDRSLPAMPPCNMTHVLLQWLSVPTNIQPTVASVVAAGDAAGSVTATVKLTGLPTTLGSNAVTFATGCAVDLGLPMQWMETQTGMASFALSFASEAQIVFKLGFDSNASAVTVEPAFMTNFSVNAKYAYSTLDGFAMDAFVSHYFTRVLVDEVATEFTAMMQELVWTAIGSTLTALVDATFAIHCPLSVFQNTHLVLTSGATCNRSHFPSPAAGAVLTPYSFHYQVNAGSLPSPTVAPVGNHSAVQALSSCSAGVPLGAPLNEIVGLYECATSGAAYGGDLFVSVVGVMPL